MVGVMTERMARLFFQRNVLRVAKSLLGQQLVRRVSGHRLAGLIVEVEAYLGIHDRAAHTYNNRHTPRNDSMWHDGGHAYVYFTYGMHHCMNVVAGRTGEPVAVLLRALEPVAGHDVMRQNRNNPSCDTDLCSGPAKLCQAFAIDRGQDGIDLTTNNTLYIEQVRKRAYPSSRIKTTPRIGVAYAGEWAIKPLRFFVKDNPHVSRPRS